MEQKTFRAIVYLLCAILFAQLVVIALIAYNNFRAAPDNRGKIFDKLDQIIYDVEGVIVVPAQSK